MTSWTVWLGFDPRESAAFAVARQSIRRRTALPLPIYGLVLSDLRTRGLYTRPTSIRDGRLWDDISDAPCSTEFSISRFLTPILAQRGWAVFMDCDVLCRANIRELFELADPTKAVQVVKHDYRPAATTKMDGQVQTTYPKKNWSSVVLWNCEHPANRALTVDVINTLPGRDLHRFCWLDEEEIGELPVEWNYLVGHSVCDDPKLLHFTSGIPSMPGYETCEYADEWWAELRHWARQ